MTVQRDGYTKDPGHVSAAVVDTSSKAKMASCGEFPWKPRQALVGLSKHCCGDLRHIGFLTSWVDQE